MCLALSDGCGLADFGSLCVSGAISLAVRTLCDRIMNALESASMITYFESNPGNPLEDLKVTVCP